MKKFALIASFWMWSISVAFATETFEEKFLNLGVDEDFERCAPAIPHDIIDGDIDGVVVLGPTDLIGATRQ